MDFVRSPVWDLRAEICDEELLRGRIARSVCYFELAGFTSGKAEPDTDSREIPISDGEPVRSVLDKAGFRRWSGGSPQMRLISRHAIIQSPLPEGGVKETGMEQFLAFPVHLGDIIVAAGLQ